MLRARMVRAPEALEERRLLATVTTVTPQESFELFANPGMGYQTFYSGVAGDPNTRHFPSQSAYWRVAWSQIEPAEGVFDWRVLDSALNQAQQSGQKLAFRVFTVDFEFDSPAWFRGLGVPGYQTTYEGRSLFVPDFNHAVVRDRISRLLNRLGSRYDGHPGIDYVDIGLVGVFGEWHFADTNPQVPMPSSSSQQFVIDRYFAEFDETPLVAAAVDLVSRIGEQTTFQYVLGKGAGWRVDCWGDWGFNPFWNHHENLYPQAVAQAGDAWRHGPVALEPCGTMQTWKAEGMPYLDSLRFALDNHASYFHSKNVLLPAEYVADFQEMLKRLGYRLVLDRVEHQSIAAAGSTLRVTMDWDNAGVAPPYLELRLAVELRQAGRAVQTTVSPADLRQWLPGTRRMSVDVPLPAGAAEGFYEIHVAILDAETLKPVRLAIQGRGGDGWYRVSSVGIAAAGSSSNQPPAATGERYTLPGLGELSVGAPGVLANDFDPDNSLLSASLVSGPAGGALLLSPDGSFVYTPKGSLRFSDSFTYRASDGNNTSNTVTVTLVLENANIAWLSGLYDDVLDRHPTVGEVKFWAGALAGGRSHAEVALAFVQSSERRRAVIRQLYADYLGRPADAAGLAHWELQWHINGSPEAVQAGMIGSAEAVERAGGIEPWIRTVYDELLNRTAISNDELSFWSDFAAETSPRAVVMRVLRSTERRVRLLGGWYADYLGRPLDAAGQQYWLGRLIAGNPEDLVLAGLLASAERR